MSFYELWLHTEKKIKRYRKNYKIITKGLQPQMYNDKIF